MCRSMTTSSRTSMSLTARTGPWSTRATWGIGLFLSWPRATSRRSLAELSVRHALLRLRTTCPCVFVARVAGGCGYDRCEVKQAGNSERSSPKPQPKTTMGGEDKKRQERQRIIVNRSQRTPRTIVKQSRGRCRLRLQESFPIDSSARVLDNIVVTHPESRYRMRPWDPMPNSTRPARTSLSMTPTSRMSVKMRMVTFVNPWERSSWKLLIAMPKVDCLEDGTWSCTSCKGIEGTRTKFLCKIMKYFIQTGFTPQFIINKLTEIADADDDSQADVRREVTNFIRKIIAGAFGVKTYDYVRANPPQRDDHLHRSSLTYVRSGRQGKNTWGDADSQQDWPWDANRLRKDLGKQVEIFQAERNTVGEHPVAWPFWSRHRQRPRVRAIENDTDLYGYGTSISSGQPSYPQPSGKQAQEIWEKDESSWRPTERGMRAGVLRLWDFE